MLSIDDEIDFALPIQRDIFGAVFGDSLESQLNKKLAQELWIGCGVFDKLESVSPHRVVPQGRRRTTGLGEIKWHDFLR